MPKTLHEKVHAARAILYEDDEERYYVNQQDGRVDLSVTGVLDEAGFYSWFQRDPEAAERGSVVHEILQLRDEGDLDRDSIDPELSGYVRAYEKALIALMPVEFIAIEHAISKGNIGGRMDRVARVGLGLRPEIWDIKTGEGAIDPIAFLQLSGYADILGVPTLARRVVQLRSGGTFEWQLKTATDWRCDYETWKAAARVATWKRANR